jgi:hypothetical protein
VLFSPPLRELWYSLFETAIDERLVIHYCKYLVDRVFQYAGRGHLDRKYFCSFKDASHQYMTRVHHSFDVSIEGLEFTR